MQERRQRLVLTQGKRVWDVEAVYSSESPFGTLSIELDGRASWVQEIAVWRPLGVGLAERRAFLWSAREVIVLPMRSDEQLEVSTFDEDIVRVFATGAGWVIVCETSVGRLADVKEKDRWQTADVIARAEWNGDVLVIADASGAETALDTSGGRLSIAR